MLFLPVALSLDFSIFIFFLFAFKSFFQDFIIFLLRRRSYFFLFAFQYHITAYFNFFSLLLYYEFDFKFLRRVIVSSLFKRARLGWGKPFYIDRFEEVHYLFFCTLFSFRFLEVGRFKLRDPHLFKARFFFLVCQNKFFFYFLVFGGIIFFFFIYAPLHVLCFCCALQCFY